MPRTNKATIALTVALVILALCAVMNVWQTNSTEAQVIALKQEVREVTRQIGEVEQRLRSGVAVAGGAAGGASAAGGVDKYAAFLEDEANLLSAPTKPMFPAKGPPGGTLRLGVYSEYKGFNWITESSVNVNDLYNMVGNYLARRDFGEPDNYVPQLAYMVTISDDFKTYTIKLREGVYWHTPAHPKINEEKYAWMREPREFTAEDVKFSFDIVRNSQVEAGSLKNYVADIDRVEVVDPYTVKIHWKKKTYQSLAATLDTIAMVPKWLYTKNEDGTDIPEATLGLQFNRHWASDYPIGTGPYRFVSYEKGVGINLEKNRDYFEGPPAVDEIKLKIVTDPEQMLLQLKSDQLDVIERMTANQYKQEILNSKTSPFAEGDLKYEIYDRFGYSYLGWNANKPMFADKRVRQALTYAMDRDGIIKNVLAGLGAPQSGTYFYKHPANDPFVKPYPYDLERAAALLEEAGWVDSDRDGLRDKVVNGERVPLEFTILTSSGSPTATAMLSIYKEALRKIGVAMNYSPLDWPTMQKKMDEKKFDAYTGGWGLDWGIDPYQLFHSSQADAPKGSNYVGFRNERADEIIEELRATFDQAKRTELYHEFHRLLAEEQPYTFLYAPKSVAGYNPRVENFQIQEIRPQFFPIPWYIDPDATE